MPAPKTTNISKLQDLSLQIKQDIINMLLKAKSGHSAGALGMTDILTTLYFNILNHDPKNPSWADRDRLILSNGHICPALYATLARAGYFKPELLKTLRKFNSPLQGHPHKHSLPGIETSSGPLGLGLSQAIGICLAAKLDSKKHETYCFLSDGELNEGQVWEAFLFAAKHKLHNLTAVIDRNNIQIDGYTEQVMPLEPLKQKLEAFNWHILEIDGHNFEEIIDAFHQAKAIFEKPVVIIAHTIPGHGVEFMEQDPSWHGKTPNQNQAKEAIEDIRSLKGKISYD
jgi:transketolase